MSEAIANATARHTVFVCIAMGTLPHEAIIVRLNYYYWSTITRLPNHAVTGYRRVAEPVARSTKSATKKCFLVRTAIYF